MPHAGTKGWTLAKADTLSISELGMESTDEFSEEEEKKVSKESKCIDTF